MNTDKELMQQALEGLEKWRWGDDPRSADDYITALRERLAQPEQEPICHLFGTLPVYDRPKTQPEQEPVAWLHPDWPNYTDRQSPVTTYMVNGWIPLYTTPPQRKPLSDEELYKVFPAIATYHEANKTLYRSIARAIEAAHGIGEKPDAA